MSIMKVLFFSTKEAFEKREQWGGGGDFV